MLVSRKQWFVATCFKNRQLSFLVLLFKKTRFCFRKEERTGVVFFNQKKNQKPEEKKNQVLFGRTTLLVVPLCRCAAVPLCCCQLRRCQLLFVTCYLLLVTCDFLVVTCYLLLVTCETNSCQLLKEFSLFNSNLLTKNNTVNKSFTCTSQVGFEPTTNRLTAERSTTELLRLLFLVKTKKFNLLVCGFSSLFVTENTIAAYQLTTFCLPTSCLPTFCLRNYQLTTNNQQGCLLVVSCLL